MGVPRLWEFYVRRSRERSVAILLLQNWARVSGCDKYVPNDKCFGMPFVSKESLRLPLA
jgi:hypothetical protein